MPTILLVVDTEQLAFIIGGVEVGSVPHSSTQLLALDLTLLRISTFILCMHRFLYLCRSRASKMCNHNTR